MLRRLNDFEFGAKRRRYLGRFMGHRMAEVGKVDAVHEGANVLFCKANKQLQGSRCLLITRRSLVQIQSPLPHQNVSIGRSLLARFIWILNVIEVESMFGGHSTLRAVIESAVEGTLGTVLVDDPSNPKAARIDLGCYTAFGGTVEASKKLMSSVRSPAELVVPDDQSWRDLLFEVWGEDLADRPMRTFSGLSLDQDCLSDIASNIPAGFSVQRLDRDDAKQLDAELTPHALQVFRDAHHFCHFGFGYGATHHGRLVSASTSYAISSKRVEVSISTKQPFRGQGLARAVAARMLLHCLKEGKHPDWSASNPVSKHLALSLGYRPAGLCDMLYLENNDRSQ